MKFRFKHALRAFAAGLSCVMACAVFAGCGGHIVDEDDSSAEATKAAGDTSEAGGDNIVTSNEDIADIPSTDGTSFVITLYADNAPVTCENFEELITSGFYDGLTFHRVVDDFMAQGGDPLGTGMGGSENNIKGEFESNGVKNDLSHLRGIVSMARSQDPDSASSQFFICYSDDCVQLDGNYAAFGRVTEGMDVVDRFTNVQRTYNEMGEYAVPVEPIRITKAEMIENDENGNHRARFSMDFKEKEPRIPVEGKFIVTLYADKAPITCENFADLVGQGFYDGLTFHRVVEGFMAQGGDPLGTGAGGSGKNIKGEFSENGVDNDLSHKRGIVSMARSQDPDSASSQFFICYDDACAALDGQYAAFGEVTEGMEVVDGFLEVERILGNDGALSSPTSPITIEKAELIDADESGNQRVEFTVKY